MDLSAALSARLSEVFGTPVEATGLRRLSGGASRETWSFEAGGRPLVLRLAPEDAGLPLVAAAPAMAREAAAFAAAARGGVPVPLLLDHGDAIGRPYLVMERLDGETIPRRLLRDDRYAAVRPHLARQCGEILARVHALRVPGLPDGDPLDALTAQYDALAEPRPAVELALSWLRLRRPSMRADTLVHGDFRNGNLLIDATGVRGVLDWELMHVGDPAEDLGWLCVKAWRFGSPHPVGGFGSRDDLLDGYAAGGGTPPEPGVLHWWEVYGTLRWAVLCRLQAERYLSGAERSIELAALGRRVCEQEHDLLLILGLTEPRDGADPLERVAPAAGVAPPAAGAAGVPAGSAGSAGARTPPHDAPDAAHLLDAVARFLTDDVTAAGDERLRFHALVAASALRIARRELLLGERQRAAHHDRLHHLGVTDDAELARRIRDGSLDDRMDAVVAAVRASVTDKLLVANPRHLSLPG